MAAVRGGLYRGHCICQSGGCPISSSTQLPGGPKRLARLLSGNEKGAAWAPSPKGRIRRRLRGAAHRRRVGAALLGRGGRGVLELLFRAEQHVQHLGAKPLVERDGKTSANEQDQQTTAALLLIAPGLVVPQRVRRVLQ